MRRLTLQVLAVVLGLLCGQAALAYTGTYPVDTGVNGTPHDLSQTSHGMVYNNPDDTLNRTCIFCHAPHNTYRLTGTPGLGPEADSAFTYLPLWNHSLTGFNTAFTPYDNGALGAPQNGPKASQAIQNGMTIGSTSLLCLSCHDGTIAANQYGNADQIPTSVSNQTDHITPGYQIGASKNLGNHHPIGFDYDLVQQADPEIREADFTMLTPISSVRDHLYGQGNTQMECATCHSVHNKGNSGETLLWRSDQNSELCLTCHNKGPYTAP